MLIHPLRGCKAAGKLICLSLKKVAYQKIKTMYEFRTEKQLRYFNEVIRLHYQEGYGEKKISKLLPVGHTTASRWIAIFAREKGKVSGREMKKKLQSYSYESSSSREVEELQKRVKELESRLLQAEIKAEFYNEMINVAESKFKIPIRKKVGAKQ
jgi:transposase